MSTASLPPLTETLTPADQAEVAAAVCRAGAAGTAVYPLGGGTTLDYGVRPTRPGVGLSLAKLTRVVDYPADDMTITVEAGMTLAELSRQLTAGRQWLPVDVPQATQATIGGAVATAAAGPRQYAYGTLRDYVLGLRAVDGRGQAFAAGGRVVKNAAGYNVCRLMVGSLGTLGVVTQVTLMVRPLPEATALVTCDVPEFDTAERLLADLVRTPLRPAAIELLAGSQGGGDALHPAGAARLVVGFDGSRSETEQMADELFRQWRAAGMASLTSVSGGEARRVWQWLADFAADVQINVRPSAAVTMIREVLAWDPGCMVLAHAGNGVLLVKRPQSIFVGCAREGEAPAEPLGQDRKPRLGRSLALPDDARIVASELSELRVAVAAARGKMVVRTHPDGAALAAADVWGPPGDGAAVMRAIKDRFDPRDILNPGRFVY